MICHGCSLFNATRTGGFPKFWGPRPPKRRTERPSQAWTAAGVLQLFLDGDLSDLRLWDSSNQVGRAPRIIWEKYHLRLYYGQMDTNGMIETEWNGYKLYKWKLHEIFPPFRDATAGQFLRWPRAERSGFTCGIQVDGCIFHPWNRQLNGKMRINERI